MTLPLTNSRLLFAGFLIWALVVCAIDAAAGQNSPHGSSAWNGEQIQWQTYEDGLALARETGRPVMMVTHATWCPYCRVYRQQFYNDQVTALADKVVPVLIDLDQRHDIARQYRDTGRYVPKTVFLTADGTVREDLHAQHPRHRYYVAPETPDELVSLLERAAGGN